MGEIFLIEKLLPLNGPTLASRGAHYVAKYGDLDPKTLGAPGLRSFGHRCSGRPVVEEVEEKQTLRRM